MIPCKSGRAKAQQFLNEAFKIDFPYSTFGKIDTLHLYGLDTEMMIFAIYKANIGRWKKVLDIGANLGLHSILLSKMGYEVTAYEPDLHHFAKLKENLRVNECNVTANMAAVHTETGIAPFVRVLHNLTGNYLKGYKDGYGPLEDTLVPTVDCRDLWPYFDFVKIDSEGNEADLLKTLTAEDMEHLSLIAEVRNEQNAKEIFEHFFDLGINIWSQKIDWGPVVFQDQMPKMNREGSIFIGKRGPW